MKKIILLGSLFTLLCISACTKQDNPTATATPEVTPTPASTAAATPAPTPSGKKITASEKSSIGEKWSKVGGYGYDMDNDGVEENITLSTSAQSSKKGDIMWDDAQQWVLEVSDGIETFTLFNENVHNGNVYIDVADYYKGDQTIPTISLIKSTGATFSVITYQYNSADNTFTEKVVLNSDDESDGGINQLYSSIPAIQ